ncbi:MAG: DUF3616 domain-containing protein [Alphaproteobacteria bacterium]|nr:DUF3616 domain-containing protein [Alphaproteobacteria bacterium]MCB9697551.1 DUF3616 domain-containing protein [Alphaproteobacteria bacterium]
MIALLPLLACGSPPTPPAPTPLERRVTPVSPGPDLVGVCDASAAVVVGRFLVVADDERNELHVFATDGFRPAPRIELKRLSPLFEGKEADLEGMTTTPDGLVWVIGSHDAGNGTTRKPERQRLLALRLREEGDGVAAELVGVATGFVDQGSEQTPLYDVVGDTEGKTAKDPTGLSIEGLSTDEQGRLLVGFRAPIAGGKALVERIDDPNGFLTGGELRLTGPRWAPLDGRGIRAMEWTGEGDALLIVAGPSDQDPGFALFRWAGFDDKRLPAEPVPVAFGDLNPEGLVRIGDRWWVVSDDGRREIDGTPCKDLPRDQRRARTASLP